MGTKLGTDAPTIQINKKGSPLTEFPGGLRIGDLTIADFFPNADIVSIAKKLADQLLVLMQNTENVAPAGCGFVMVDDVGCQGGINNFNTGWPAGADGVNPHEVCLIASDSAGGDNAPVVLITQPLNSPSPVYIRPGEREAFKTAIVGGNMSMSFFGEPIVQRPGVVQLTNNVAPGGTTDVLATFTGSVYATDSAAIRNDIYQLGRKINLILTALQGSGAGLGLLG